MAFPKLDELRERLRTSNNFQDIFIFFMDHFGENRVVQERSRRYSDPNFEATLAATVAAMTGAAEPVQLTHLVITRLGGERLVHGGGLHGLRVAAFFYFTDDDRGLVALTLSSTLTQYARFSAALPVEYGPGAPESRGGNPSPN